ncbi:MAG TPA: uroporphyrinogen-III synthase [Blastocatellia bacterium]|jgi:uroporphyrinogen III methyltransferase/synthase|nr:uroporphyrinogen-III synthase [Blastocatellia bacterium]
MSEKKDRLGIESKCKRSAADPAPRLLDGHTILVTRSRDQSLEITSLFEALGAAVVHLPTIEIIAPASWSAVDSAAERLETYDWLVFTSANAARHFFARVKDRPLCAGAGSAGPRICSIGPATTRAVKEAGAAVDLTSAGSRAEGVMDSIIEYLGGEGRVRGLRFLIPQSQIARKELPERLVKLGAIVEAVEAYRTIRPGADCEAVRRMLREGAIDAITFTSPSTVSNFAGLFGASDLSSLIGAALVGCIGPTTAAAAREFGLQDVIQPELYNGSALVDAIARNLTRKDRSEG